MNTEFLICFLQGGGRQILSLKKMQHNSSEKMFTEMAKSIRIIGDPDNQRPDKWSSTLLVLMQLA
jgi:hypothetical protein